MRGGRSASSTWWAATFTRWLLLRILEASCPRCVVNSIRASSHSMVSADMCANVPAMLLPKTSGVERVVRPRWLPWRVRPFGGLPPRNFCSARKPIRGHSFLSGPAGERWRFA